MSTKPETTFYTSVHRFLPPSLHREKMFNPYRGGTWDFWLSGLKSDLWIEYKWLAKIPKAALITPDLSPKQQHWGNSRLSEGRKLAVIVGTPEGGVRYTHGAWNYAIAPQEFRAQLMPRKELAHWIEGITCLGWDV